MTSQQLHNQRTWNAVFIHIAAWCILLILPAIFTERFRENSPLNEFSHLRFFVQPICIIVIFYINYFLLIDKLLFRKKITLFITNNVIFIILCCIIVYITHHLIGGTPPQPHQPPLLPHFHEFTGYHHHHHQPRSLFLPWQDILILVLSVGLSIAIKGTQQWISSESERQQLEQKRTEAELINLKNQLNPHFLFNTLNNIYSLIAISPEQAQCAVLELSKLLRYMLYETSQDRVDIEQELEFNRNYIELMLLRLARHVKVDIHIPDNLCQGYKIAPLLFISLIENAFKHGTGATQQSFVNICMSEPKSGVIACDITNSYFPKNESDKSGSGIGLKNLTRQLELLYPQKYTLILDHDGKTYRSSLTIDLN